MSTMRKLRRTMRTPDAFSELLKPPCKIANLREDDRELVRCLIRDFVEQDAFHGGMELNLNEAAQTVESHIDSGTLKIVLDESPANAAGIEEPRYTIVPAGKL